MSTPVKVDKTSDSINPEAVAEYLQAYPDFFAHYPNLVTELHIPHGAEGTVSLVSHQITRFRENQRKLEHTLQEMVENAKANEILIQRLHELIQRLMTATESEALFDILQTQLSEQFNMDAVVLRLFIEQKDIAAFAKNQPVMAMDSPEYRALKSFIGSDAPIIVTQQLPNEHAAVFFSDPAMPESLQSMSILPLGGQTWYGALLLGSIQASHFDVDMAVDLLKQLGAFLNIILSRHIADKAGRH